MHASLRLAVSAVSLWTSLVFALPPPSPSALAVNRSVTVGTGRMVEVEKPQGVVRVAIRDPDVVDVKVLEHTVVLVGGKKGSTAIVFELGAGERERWLVDVYEGDAPPRSDGGGGTGASTSPKHQPPLRETVTLKRGATLTKNAPAELARLAVGDPAVCDIRLKGQNGIELVGMTEGITTVLVWLKGGGRLEWLVKVTP